MTTRKIIQIAVALTSSGSGHNQREITYSLCNDGTLWELKFGDRWEKCVPIPQPRKGKNKKRR